MLFGVSPATPESNGAIEQMVVFLGTMVSFSTCRTDVYIYVFDCQKLLSES